MSWQQISDLPSWAYQMVWTLVTLGALYLLGQFIARRICRRLTRWAEKTHWQWDEIVIEALRRGVPFWAVLIGCQRKAAFEIVKGPHELRAEVVRLVRP